LNTSAFADVLIKNKNASEPARIVAKGHVELPKDAKIRVIDAKGAYACPGFTDLRTNLAPQGAGVRQDPASVTAAAEAGGYSICLVCPPTAEPIDTLKALNIQKSSFSASERTTLKSLATMTVGGFGHENVNFKAMLDAGAMGFYDCGSAAANVMREAMTRCFELGATIYLKCCESSLSGGIMNEGQRALQMKLGAIPSLCEELALAKNLMLAKDTGCKIHVSTVSTKGSVEMIRRAKADGVSVTCDTCPQYFTLTEDQLLFKGTAAKVDPPLRCLDDVLAVIDGIADGTIDAISTDHTPCDNYLKGRSMASAPFGMLMLESALLIGITSLLSTGKVSIYRLIDAMCYAPSRILFGNGYKPTGLNLFSTGTETFVPRTFFKGGYTNSPFTGWHFTGKNEGFFSCIWE
jgi:dihydroorotase